MQQQATPTGDSKTNERANDSLPFWPSAQRSERLAINDPTLTIAIRVPNDCCSSDSMCGANGAIKTHETD
jgi:hypothetical protein